LVTGASGYVGRALLKYAPREWSIGATYLTHPLACAPARSFRLDIRDAEAVQRVTDAMAPDAVIHTAAVMQGEMLTSVNVNGARHVARAAARVRARLVHLSSDVLFDGEHAPYTEDSPPAPITPYAFSKAGAERAVAEECPGAVVVRTSLVYGLDPIDPRTRQILTGGMPMLYTDEYRCPICVDDLARALLELSAGDYAGILNVAGPQALSRYEFGLKLAAAFRVSPRFKPGASSASGTPRPRNCTLDTSRAQTMLRAPLRSVDQVLRQLDR
jgi:dTDP-4-dehydrorhamnose reductase